MIGCRLWKLKDPSIREEFHTKVEDRLNQAVVNDTDNLDVVWGILRNCLIDLSDEVCGKTKGGQLHIQTWWWNDEVAEAVREKRRLYKIFDKSKNIHTIG